MAVDTSGGPSNGTIYIAWEDNRQGDRDVYLTKSTNQGASWSTPLRVNTDQVANGRSQWLPWINVGPEGFVNVVFYDNRDDTILTTLYLARSLDGGQSFQNKRVSDVAFTPLSILFPGGYMGHYLGLASDKNFIYPCWNDNRDGLHRGYVAKVPTGIQGTVASSTTWDADVYLIGDVVIPSGVTLTIAPGTRVIAAADRDDQRGGVDTNQVEIVVYGNLVIDSGAAPTRFHSLDGTPGSWVGIRADSNAQISLNHVYIRDAYCGLDVRTERPCTVYCAVIESCLVYGVYTKSDSLLIRRSIIRDIPDGYGVKGAGAVVNLKEDSIYGCNYGVHLDYFTRGQVLNSVILAGNASGTAGIYTEYDPFIWRTEVKGGFSDGGIVVNTKRGAPTIYECGIDGDGTAARGLVAGEWSKPRVRCSKIRGQTSRAVFSWKSATDLGRDTAGQWGNNWIYLDADTVISAHATTVTAKRNYFDPPPADTQNFHGPVQWEPQLALVADTCGFCCAGWGTATPPGGGGEAKVAVSVPTEPGIWIQNYPNPFNPSTVVAYTLSSPVPVKVTIYNILGQKIRSLVDEFQPAGRYQVEWDGRDGTGQPVASGVYLYRLEAGAEVISRKMVVIR